ncbi:MULTISPECIES: low temperature requirement protein A [unclassified Streptomyces]|uniref:low temperature requirement protein A n=1 Tax=unclassified Streptomyces TaxID=2593676 RepID=UPI00099ECB64|nr:MULTISPECIES: low temperature requirement protein A [unclassified Streptomyces]
MTQPFLPLTARSREESHRASTPLELFFDLCFVVAVAQAGAELVHAVAEGHAGEGIINYAMIFFAIWWAWMNFTWFASAYDNDDVLYRVITLLQIAGVLVLAAGVSRAFEEHDFLVVYLGYLVMRLALASQWLRAAYHATDPVERTMCLRYAGGVVTVQIGWLALLLAPEPARPWVFLVMALAEMAVPLYAEKDEPSTWHPHHIAERYGLFTIIVLGETVAAATVAVKTGIAENDALGEVLPIAAGGLLLVFAAWWIYFVAPAHDRLTSSRQGFLWGYGHYVIFASAAAVGAGLEIAVEQAVGKAHISALAAASSVTIPSAVFLMSVWLLHARYFKIGLAQQLVLPVTALAILLCSFAGRWAVLAAGLVAAVSVAIGVTLTASNPATRGDGGSTGADTDTGTGTGTGTGAGTDTGTGTGSAPGATRS